MKVWCYGCGQRMAMNHTASRTSYRCRACGTSIHTTQEGKPVGVSAWESAKVRELLKSAKDSALGYLRWLGLCHQDERELLGMIVDADDLISLGDARRELRSAPIRR